MKLLTNRWFHILILLALLGGVVFTPVHDARWAESLRFSAFDKYNAMKPRPPSGQVVIVDIDDDSLAKIGQWPWPRTEMARLILRLDQLGAGAIAFDGVLAEPDQTSPQNFARSLPDSGELKAVKEELAALPDHDEVLAKAVAEAGNFVTAFTFGTYSQHQAAPRLVNSIAVNKKVKSLFLKDATAFKTAAVFLPEIEKAAAGNGSFMATPEFDGIIRKAGLFFSDRKELYPSLSLEALRVAMRDQKPMIKIGRNEQFSPNSFDTEYRALLGNYAIPVEADGNVWVYFRKFDRKSDYLSAHLVMEPDETQAVRDRIKDKIVFIGSSAEGLKDLRSTPLQPFIPGVEIHANVVEQILQGKYLLRPLFTYQVELQFILVVGITIIILSPFINALYMALVCASLIALTFAGSWHLYDSKGILLDPVYPSLCVMAIFIVSSFLTYIRSEAERRQVRQAFGLYISPDFMKELTKHPDKLRLGGETRELTVMFSDIRNFTTISERLSPEALIQLMNDFLTPMSDLVMSHRGTIDKYMGDAMMAFWNAPLDDPGHARHACTTALKMNTALVPINDRLKAMAETEGRVPVLLKAGIGINTGPASVGNMGSRQRFAYSALGDTVNLASRLEGQTKYYGSSILIGPETQRQIPDFATLELDLIRVKGKTEPVRLFALLGEPEYTRQDFFGPWKAAHEAMIKAYREADFDQAESFALQSEHLSEGRLLDFYAMIRARILTLKTDRPSDGWDGVYAADSK